MSKDEDILHDIAAELQSDSWFNLVAETYAEQRGVPLTENLRRQIVAQLRAETHVEIKPKEPKPH